MRVVLVLLLALASGCDGYRVTRLYGGRAREQQFISEQAYEAHVRAAELEARGDDRAAVQGYLRAIAMAPENIEAWTRVLLLECRSGRSAEAEQAVARALRLDPRYAGLWRAIAECAEARGTSDVKAAMRALELDATNDEIALLGVRALLHSGDAGEATNLLRELALRAPESTAVWRAILAHARTAHDEGWQREAERRLFTLEPRRGSRDAELGPLFLALSRRDGPLAKRIAHALRLGPLAVAVAALSSGQAELALVESERRVAADPEDTDARLLAALAADLAGAPGRIARALGELGTDLPSEVGELALGELLARHVSEDAAKLWLAGDARASELPAALIARLRARDVGSKSDYGADR